MYALSWSHANKPYCVVSCRSEVRYENNQKHLQGTEHLPWRTRGLGEISDTYELDLQLGVLPCSSIYEALARDK